MDSSFVSSIELPAESWRRLTLVLAAIAVVEAVVILVAGVVLAVRPFAHHLASSNASSEPLDLRGKTGPDTPAGKPALTRRQTVVMVLNGNGRTGAAAAEAQQIRGLGYKIGRVGNAPQTTYGRSVVMYRPGFRPEAVRLARDTRILIVTPLDGLRRSRLQGAHVAVILGAG